MSTETPSENTLKLRALRTQKRFLGMYRNANAGHVGSSLSCSDLMTWIRCGWMSGQDEFVLSKGHAAAALYASLVETGDVPEEAMASFYRDGTLFSAHPPPKKLPRVPFATGSLGHGLSLAAGLALAETLKGTGNRVFTITSDGELNEGSIWEAALFAQQHRLRNLTWIIDRNYLQGFGRTEDVMRLEPLDEKIRAFGFDVFTTDAHDFADMIRVQKEVDANRSDSPLPKVIIGRSIKGRGIPNLENTVDCHYLPLKTEQYDAMIATLDRQISDLESSGASL